MSQKVLGASVPDRAGRASPQAPSGLDHSATIPCAARMPVPSLRWRFWARVPIGNAADCWIWSGGRNGQGYPQLSDGPRSFVATRLMREFIDGAPVPHDAVVCHSCDNPPCVNPAHLWIGTKQDNSLDMVTKGRRVQRAPLTHCYRGHELTPENTLIERGKVRRCRICRSRRNRAPMEG